MRSRQNRNNKKMPGLTLDTSPRATNSSQPSQPQSQTQPYSQSPSNPRTSSISNSRSASPVRPPYSPLTPTLRAARLATTESSQQRQQQNNGSTPTIAQPPRQTYTHSQPAQTSIPQPPPVPIDFADNPDAIALKSAISILQIQARNAASDIKNLQKVKERALEDPEGFSEALGRGEIKVKPDPWRNPGPIEDDEDDDEDEKMVVEMNEGEGKEKKWPLLPTPQDVVRCPPINWTQYAVVGDSLDKLHKDQQARPTEGMPQRVGPDGQLVFGGEGQRRAADVGVVAPFAPGKDKIEKKKGGKK
ncbi:hypothetical protein B0J14DRAFT_596397 [Halenospora varia]|nr:hypothetical protein B0J14DRAFT_596397 [Halenospora varia]